MLHCMERANLFIMTKILMCTTVLNWTKSLTFEVVQKELLPVLQEVLKQKGICVKQTLEKTLLAMPLDIAHQVRLK